MSDTAIKVENLSKRYPFDCAQGRLLGLKEELPDTFIGALTAWLKAQASKSSPASPSLLLAGPLSTAGRRSDLLDASRAPAFIPS